ncbi:MBOAT family O-acyltransferase [Alloiococcus sp. CFN-8]|uniref:MBOAT family O-acyltransferase n=1 Tax=Alloiococcus sp. CFN-8 TaxID=3416081 RepID=UPI003CF634FC
MVFSSLLFLFIFLPLVLFSYFMLPKKYRNLQLFIVSLIFYAWGEPIYISLMLFSTVVDYFHGIQVHKNIERGNKKKARLFLISDLTINLGLLCFFKYGDFIIQNVNLIFKTNIPLMNLPLPIGISFYTFQTMSYTIDIYRGKVDLAKNIIDFGAYVAMFPQLIAGPIVKYKDVYKELRERRETFDSFGYGVRRFILGLGKKVLFANNIGLLWEEISSKPLGELSVVGAWLGIAAFALQIYFDFSGYSDMAIGLGRIFGFNFSENFNYPYISQSITEFWRRWHISLGTWFKENVYIPLGGNKKGYIKQLRNIAIVWLLTGIWHGASWNFLLWGVYFAIILIIEKIFLLKLLKKLPSLFRSSYAIILVLLSWVIFAFDDYSIGFDYLKALLGMWNNSFIDNNAIYLIYTNGLLLIALILGSTPLPATVADKFLEKYKEKELLVGIMEGLFLVMIFFLSIAFIVDSSYNPFLYFRF